MRFAHLSDLHFGTVDPLKLEKAKYLLHSLALDLVAVSGDLTQRAKPKEFQAAKCFLQSLNLPFIAIPGNHDVPLYRFWERFFAPFWQYGKAFGPELEPHVETDQVILQGLNTAFGFTFSGGRLGWRSLRLLNRWEKLPPTKLRILMVHHPVDPFPLTGDIDSPQKQRILSARLSEVKFDLLLLGHHHHSEVKLSSELYQIPHSPFIASMAGTPFSKRVRHDGNSLHIVEALSDSITIQVYFWAQEKENFECLRTHLFRRDSSSGWQRIKTS